MATSCSEDSDVRYRDNCHLGVNEDYLGIDSHKILLGTNGSKIKKRTSAVHSIDSVDTHHFTGLNVASVFTDLLSHPFIVIRRQCQVNRTSHCYHITPITLIPVTISLHQRQGFSTLWKGIGSIFLFRGLTAASETILSEITSFPREITSSKSLTNFLKHFILKGLSSAVVTSFLSASLIETVQSDIASDKPGALDFLKEGLCRLLGWGMPQTTRLLPIWVVAIPTVTYRVLHCMFSYLVQYVTRYLMQNNLHSSVQHGASPKGYPSVYDHYYIEIVASFMAHLFSDLLLYPLETVLYRLHLQGTRTIIDNLDSGLSVVPIISKYEGMSDCFNSIIEEEGIMGLYKGFGALIIQYSLQVFILKGTRLILQEVSLLINSTTKPTDQ